MIDKEGVNDMKTVLVSIALTGKEHRPAFEAIPVLPGGVRHIQVSPTTEDALVDYVRKLYREAQETGIVGTGEEMLIAGRMEEL